MAEPATGDTPTIDFDAPEVQELINSRVEEQTKALKRNNATILSEKKKLQEWRDSLGDDFDPEEYQALKEAHQKAEEDKATKAGEWEKLKAQLVDGHTKALEGKDAELKEIHDALIAEKRDAALLRSLAGAKATEEGVELLSLRLRDLVRVERGEDGAYVRRVYLPGSDTPQMKADGSYWDTDDLMGWAKEKYPSSYEGTNHSGGGTRSSEGGASGSGRVTAEQAGKMSMAEYAQARKEGRLG